jgi:hypothetical protein
MSETNDDVYFEIVGDSTDCRLSDPDENGKRHWITTKTHFVNGVESEPVVIHGPTPTTDVLDALVRPMLGDAPLDADVGNAIIDEVNRARRKEGGGMADYFNTTPMGMVFGFVVVLSDGNVAKWRTTDSPMFHTDKETLTAMARGYFGNEPFNVVDAKVQFDTSVL